MVNRRFGKKMKASSEKRKSSGFAYKPTSAKRLKERSERRGGSFDSIFKNGVDMYQLKTGAHACRILPPTWDDHEHFGYTVYMHMRIGPDGSDYICPRKTFNKRCAACEASAELKRAGEDDEAYDMAVKERVLYYVLDRDEDDNIPRVWNLSGPQDREISGLCLDRRSGEAMEIDNPDAGFDLTFKRTGKGKGTRYTNWQFDREETPIADDQSTYDEILQHIEENPLPSLLVYAKNEKIEAAVNATGKEADPDDDGDDDDNGRSKKRRARDDDDEDVDEAPRKKKRRPADDDDDDYDDEPAPKKKRRPADDDDDDDGKPWADDDDDDDEPSPKKKKRPADDDDDEDEPPRKKRRPADDDEEEDERPRRKLKRR